MTLKPGLDPEQDVLTWLERNAHVLVNALRYRGEEHVAEELKSLLYGTTSARNFRRHHAFLVFITMDNTEISVQTVKNYLTSAIKRHVKHGVYRFMENISPPDFTVTHLPFSGDREGDVRDLVTLVRQIDERIMPHYNKFVSPKKSRGW